MRSQLARFHREPATSAGQLRAMAARAWHDYGAILIWPKDLRDDFERQAVIGAAVKLYGRRKNDETRT